MSLPGQGGVLGEATHAMFPVDLGGVILEAFPQGGAQGGVGLMGVHPGVDTLKATILGVVV